MGNIKIFLRDRLITDNTTLFGYAQESYQIKELISRTVSCGESNSALIIGPKGCGKSTLIASVLSELLPQPQFTSNSQIVHLNGFVHIDDGAALRSITKQLNLETAVDGKVFTNFADNLAFLLDCLRSGDKKQSKSVIFILEEFDLFCNHNNQTLIYNLFDVAQSAQAPICVIGLTRRNDVIETLEKRVKSRFSHRQIFLFSQNIDMVEAFKELLKEIKQIGQKPKISGNQALNFLTNNFDVSNHMCEDTLTNAWNKHIDKLATNKMTMESLAMLNDLSVSIAQLKNILFNLVVAIPLHVPPSAAITRESVQKCIDDWLEYDDKIAALLDLSVLELSLIIAIKHHSEIYERGPFNFEMILTRYHKFLNSIENRKENHDRTLVLKAFEVLKNVGVIVPVSASSKGQKEFQMYRLLLSYNQISKAVDSYKHLPTNISQWAKSSLV